MPRSIEPAVGGEALRPLPTEFAVVLQPELPSLIKEIRLEVTRAYPEYAALLDGPYGESIRFGVEQSLSVFVERVASPSATSSLRDELCRGFGRFEAYEGRNLESLQGAYRLGARLALRRAQKLGRRYSLSPALILSFADAILSYVDELEALSRDGYMEAQARNGTRDETRRRRLLHLILAGRPVPQGALTELAEQTGWRLPEQVTLVALRGPLTLAQGDLDIDVLFDLSYPQPHLLIPGPVDEDRRRSLGSALGATRAAVGLTVDLADAADSLRWARRTLELVESKMIADSPLVFARDELTTLWLLSDPALVAHLAALELAPLDGLPASRRDRLVETLRVWLTTRGTADQVSSLLGVHPQTVRYRLRNIDSHFGDRLADPGHRFATEAVLRALELQGNRYAD
ncbi:PucR family transcriptional regulator [Streptomyces physcomitrii]|uniref:PucR family transcriptional regulator n=1 Tax=Streptomyces physcomitrii TaxID=2724184 RepID=A0ABX1H3X8_9ACTN|nr:helix-turn-helix domain-containing protein [Streptomyces physcomitrii]NKI43067.1 PucR family transcriptional regulator [Streptomyces physcomitrii]